LGRTADGLTTTASSSGCPSEIVEAPKRGTDVASFFGLSSSLRRSHSTSTRRKRIKDRKDGVTICSKLTSPEHQTS
jgi:hypothetical protein